MREKYLSLSLGTLKELAKARGMKGISTLKKSELIERMLQEDEKDKKIGETLNDKNNGISIKINDEILKFNVVENKEHIINVTNKDIILFSIIKSRLRFGRKNIYKIKSMEWKYDIELLILLVAFCDVVFFPEWRLFSWGELEYDLLEIDLKKNKK